MINGLLVVDKPIDWTSHDVIAKLRSIFKQKKIGHTGTLDPMATGVLVVCLGRFTKLVDRITAMTKTYEVEFDLGYETDTEDKTGTIINTSKLNPDKTKIKEVIYSFIGEQEQVPPMYSAIKVDGKKLYELARKGEFININARLINIYNIYNIMIDELHIKMTVECSKGVYIRSLVRDIGRKLGCYACMTKLRRTRVGSYSIDQSYTINEIEMSPQCLLDIRQILPEMKKIHAIEKADKLLINGNQIPINYIKEDVANGEYLLYDSKDNLFGIYEAKNDKIYPSIILYTEIGSTGKNLL